MSLVNAVTGAFSYTGKYITKRLLSLDEKVINLTSHPNRPNPFADHVPTFPLNFDNPGRLLEALQSVSVLYNTYWVRFPYRDRTFNRALHNTLTLFWVAKQAGVRRVVHISITNASETSEFAYFRGKGLVEKALMGLGLSYAIIRPTLVFGPEDILINNIAWLLRRSPIFGIFGPGNYRVQPIYVEDLAQMVVDAGHKDENIVTDAVGPEVYTFEELVRLIRSNVKSRAKILHLKPEVALLVGKLFGLILRDVIITRQEIKALMSNLLISRDLPTEGKRLSQWVKENADALGRCYASELDRHYR